MGIMLFLMAFSHELLAATFETVSDPLGRTFYPSEYNARFVRNPIPGRGGFVADFGALQEFNAHKGDVNRFLSLYSFGYGKEAISVGDLYRMSCGLYLFPVYLALRVNAPVESGMTPESLIDASRAAAGIMRVTRMIYTRSKGGDLLMHPKDIYDFGNGGPQRENYFTAPHSGKSCPAGEDQVIRVLERLMERSISAAFSAPSDWDSCVRVQDVLPSVDFGVNYMLYSVHQMGLGSLDESQRAEKEIKREKIKANMAAMAQALGYGEQS